MENNVGMRDIRSSLEAIQNQLRNNLQSVIGLTKFDDALISIILSKLTGLSERLSKANIDNPKLLPDDTIRMIEQIHDHNSLQINFRIIYNQSVVLAISFLTSTLEELFKTTLENVLSDTSLLSDYLQKEEIKINIKDLTILNRSFPENLAAYLFDRKGISFQDMQSTVRTFKNFLDIEIEKDDLQRSLIFVQAARHIITHAGGRTTEKFWQQIESATPRQIKQDFSAQEIDFVPGEIEEICSIVENFVSGIVEKLINKYSEVRVGK